MSKWPWWMLVLLTVLALSAGTARAVNDWGYTGCNDGSEVEKDNRICFDFNSSLSPASTSFTVKSRNALACFKADDTTEGAATAQIVIRYAPTSDVSSAANSGVQVCADAGCTLTGANGTPAAQLACVVLGPGRYRVDATTLPAGAEVSILSVQGGGD